jgi:hypothetical protein
MKPCRGIHRLICKLNHKCPKGISNIAYATCLDCPGVVIEILDLDDKIIACVPLGTKERAESKKKKLTK